MEMRVVIFTTRSDLFVRPFGQNCGFRLDASPILNLRPPPTWSPDGIRSAIGVLYAARWNCATTNVKRRRRILRSSDDTSPVRYRQQVVRRQTPPLYRQTEPSEEGPSGDHSSCISALIPQIPENHLQSTRPVVPSIASYRAAATRVQDSGLSLRCLRPLFRLVPPLKRL
jgi:hypothetical protein